MSDDSLLSTDKDATPIEPDDLQYLIPRLTTRAELNQWEAANIENGLASSRRSRIIRRDLLSLTGIRAVHKRMFDQTWTWAGDFRQRTVTFGGQEGSPAWRITTDCTSLCEDVKVWREYQSYDWDEIAARFHHRLVLIHPFPNGNGRHSRHMVDLLLEQNGLALPTWGGGSLVATGNLRTEYISALHEADQGDMARLIRFMKAS